MSVLPLTSPFDGRTAGFECLRIAIFRHVSFPLEHFAGPLYPTLSRPTIGYANRRAP